MNRAILLFLLALSAFFTVSCSKKEIVPSEPILPDPWDVPVAVKGSYGFPGGYHQGNNDSVEIFFSGPIQVTSLNGVAWDDGAPSLPFRYSSDRRTITARVSMASIGSELPYHFTVRGVDGSTLDTSIFVPFYRKKIRFEGFVTHTFLDAQTGLYWVAMKYPNFIQCYSPDTLGLISQITLPWPPKKFVLNPYNHRLYTIVIDDGITGNPPNPIVHVIDPETGREVKSISCAGDSISLPYDIGFTASGYGIVLLRDAAGTNFSWKIIDSRQGDTVYSYHASGGAAPPREFGQAYLNHDNSGIILSGANGAPTIDILDGASHAFSHTQLPAGAPIIFLQPNRTDNRIFVGQDGDQYIIDPEGNATPMSYIPNLNFACADFSHRPGERNFIYYMDYINFEIVDYDSASIVLQHPVSSILRQAAATLDGNHILAYSSGSVYDYIYLFAIEDFSGYGIRHAVR